MTTIETNSNRSGQTELKKYLNKVQENPDIIIGLILAIPIVLLYIIALDSLTNKTTWFIGTITAISVFFIGAISLDLEVGSMGLPNFGKVAFFAIGAEISALLYTEYHVNFLVGVVVTLIISAIFGFIISIPTVKLRADYFAIMTIAGGEVIRLVLLNESRWLWSTSLDGTKSQVITNTLRTEFQLSSPFDMRITEFLGSTILEDIGSGIIDVAQAIRIPILIDVGSGIIEASENIRIPIISEFIEIIGGFIKALGTVFSDIISLIGDIIHDLGSVFLWEIGFLIVFCFFALIVYWFVQQIRKSPYGRTLRAIREDDISVTSVGKNVSSFRWQITTLSAIICGLAGVLYGLTFSSFEAKEFTPFITFNLYIFIIIGGLGNSRGAFIGTALVIMFTRATQAQVVKDLVSLHIGPDDIIFGPLVKMLRVDIFLDPEVAAIVVLGTILILFLLFKPAGLIPESKTETEKYLSLLTPEERRRSDEAVQARQSLSEKERLASDTDHEETPPSSQ